MYRLFIICFFLICLSSNLCLAQFFEDLFSLHLEETNDVLVSKKNVKIFLYTRNNPLNYEQILIDNLYYLKWTHFDPDKPIKIIVHGWKCSYRSAYNILIKDAYLIQNDVNVIIIDWSKYSKLSYLLARDVVSNIADIVAEFVNKLYNNFKINLENIHIVGHSLGAHVAGIAGLRTLKKVGRITGLDPAGPGFSMVDEERISNNSAKFVDIIHTAGRSAGFYHEMGHVDFYPNGGTPIQPGCGFDFLTLRSHRRAYWLFAESIITPDGFLAVKCDSWQNYKNLNCGEENKTTMGEHVSPNARGKYFLRTNYRSPFALETLYKQSRYNNNV